jgi:hypothetical protein
LEEQAKGEDWGLLKSAAVFIVFFSLFIYFITSKNTEAARLRARKS